MSKMKSSCIICLEFARLAEQVSELNLENMTCKQEINSFLDKLIAAQPNTAIKELVNRYLAGGSKKKPQKALKEMKALLHTNPTEAAFLGATMYMNEVTSTLVGSFSEPPEPSEQGPDEI
jgi:hypothetical protein